MGNFFTDNACKKIKKPSEYSNSLHNKELNRIINHRIRMYNILNEPDNIILKISFYIIIIIF